VHKLSFLPETDQKYSQNKFFYSISIRSIKRVRDQKSSESVASKQEVKVLVQIGKEVMFYQ